MCHGPFSLISWLWDQSSFPFPQFAFSTLYYWPLTLSHLKLPLLCGLHFWLICVCHISQMSPEWGRKQRLVFFHHRVRVLALCGWAWGARVWRSQSERQTWELHTDCRCHSGSRTRGPGSSFSFKRDLLGMWLVSSSLLGHHRPGGAAKPADRGQRGAQQSKFLLVQTTWRGFRRQRRDRAAAKRSGPSSPWDHGEGDAAHQPEASTCG